MNNRSTETFDWKKGTRYLKNSGILIREQSVDRPSLFAAAASVSGMFCASKKQELITRFDRAVYDGAFREAYLLILTLYWDMEERAPKLLRAIAANKPVFEEFCEMVSEQNEFLWARMQEMERAESFDGEFAGIRKHEEERA